MACIDYPAQGLANASSASLPFIVATIINDSLPLNAGKT
jgi:hypothetical protein